MPLHLPGDRAVISKMSGNKMPGNKTPRNKMAVPEDTAKFGGETSRSGTALAAHRTRYIGPAIRSFKSRLRAPFRTLCRDNHDLP